MNDSEQRCPVCEGKGELTRLRARGDCEVSPYSKGMFICHRCSGQGTIAVLGSFWSPPIVSTGVVPNPTGVTIGGAQQYLDTSQPIVCETNDVVIDSPSCAYSPEGEPHDEDCEGLN